VYLNVYEWNHLGFLLQPRILTFPFLFFRCKEEEVLLAGVDPVASTLFCCLTYEQLVLPDQE
jgi:hypothetical protein